MSRTATNTTRGHQEVTDPQARYDAHLRRIYGDEFLEWYNNAVAQLKGTQWESQIMGLNQNQYSPGLWSQLKGLFGDDSDEVNFYNQDKANIRENIESLLESKRQQEYNNPAAEAARRAAAGENPSLTGNLSGGDPGAITDPTEDVAPQAASTGPEIIGQLAGAVSTIVGGSMDIISKGIALSNGIEQLAHNRSQNSIDELQEIMDSVPDAANFLANLTPGADWTDPATGELVKAGTPLTAAQTSAYVDGLGLRPGASKLMKSLLGRVRYDEKGNPTTGYNAAYNKLVSGSLEDAQKAVEVMSSPGFRPNLYAWSAEYNGLVGDLNVEILQAQKRCALAIAKYDAQMHSEEMSESDYVTRLAGNEAEQALSEFNEEYYNKLDADQQAAMQNDENRARAVQAAQARMESEIDQAYLKHFDLAIQKIKDRNLPPEQEAVLLSGVYQQRNEYLMSIQERNTERLTKAGKTIGDTDWLNAGTDVVGDLLDFVPKLRNPFKRKGKGKTSGSR